MATQTSGNGQRRQQRDEDRYRDREGRRMHADYGDRGRSETDDERDWRGRGEEGGDRWREQHLSSWDQDRGRSFDRGRGDDRAWDQRGDQMYGAGQSRRDQFGDNEYLDE